MAGKIRVLPRTVPARRGKSGTPPVKLAGGIICKSIIVRCSQLLGLTKRRRECCANYKVLVFVAELSAHGANLAHSVISNAQPGNFNAGGN